MKDIFRLFSISMFDHSKPAFHASAQRPLKDEETPSQRLTLPRLSPQRKSLTPSGGFGFLQLIAGEDVLPVVSGVFILRPRKGGLGVDALEWRVKALRAE